MHVAGEAIGVKAVDLVFRGRSSLGQERQPFGPEVNPGADRSRRRQSGHAVEAIAAKDEVAANRGPVIAANDRSVTELYRLHRRGEADLGTHRAKRIDQVTHQKLLGIDVVTGSAQGPVVEDMPYASTPELTSPEGLPPHEHPIRQAIRIEKPSSAVLDQTRPAPGPGGTLVEAFEYLTVDPRTNQHVRREQSRGPCSNDPYRAHRGQFGTWRRTHPLDLEWPAGAVVRSDGGSLRRPHGSNQYLWIKIFYAALLRGGFAVGAFDEFPLLEPGAGTDQRDQVGGIHGAPA